MARAQKREGDYKRTTEGPMSVGEEERERSIRLDAYNDDNNNNACVTRQL